MVFTIGGSKGGARDYAPHGVEIILFSCSVLQKKLDDSPHFRHAAPYNENSPE